MIKKTLHYHDHDGKAVSGDFYFNLSKAELAEQAILEEEGFVGWINKIIASKKKRETVDAFKWIIEVSYGVRDPADPTIFDKDPSHFRKFKSTDAYSELFMELLTDEDAAGTFIRGIVPAELARELPKEIPTEAVVEHLPRPKGYSAMSEEDLQNVMQQLREGKGVSPEILAQLQQKSE